MCPKCTTDKWNQRRNCGWVLDKQVTKNCDRKIAKYSAPKSQHTKTTPSKVSRKRVWQRQRRGIFAQSRCAVETKSLLNTHRQYNQEKDQEKPDTLPVVLSTSDETTTDTKFQKVHCVSIDRGTYHSESVIWFSPGGVKVKIHKVITESEIFCWNPKYIGSIAARRTRHHIEGIVDSSQVLDASKSSRNSHHIPLLEAPIGKMNQSNFI